MTIQAAAERRRTEGTPPWTPDQIASANAFQHAGIMHPFTCGGERCREDLIAKPDGWHCPKCEYQQGWAHDFMLDWAWLKADPFRRTKESFGNYILDSSN